MEKACRYESQFGIMNKSFNIFCFCLALLSCTWAETIVQTQNGPVKGIIQQSRNPGVSYVSFFGLRYADPPARFEAAKSLSEKWTEPKMADTPGSVCLQPAVGGSDDCLFLNVHVPTSALKDPKKRLSVMFWIHGGGFMSGEGHNYGAKYLLENDDVILVTVNHRLGAFGFAAMENDTTFTSNNGLRDLVLALKWTQENIEAFHGNPEKVTIFGESAGSAAINYLLMSSLFKGLFHRAIMQSGSHAIWSQQPNPRQNVVKLAQALKCPNTEDSKEIRKCLENKPGIELANRQVVTAERWPSNFPLCRFVPTTEEPKENAFFNISRLSYIFNESRNVYPNKVPVMLGWNRDEGSNMLSSTILHSPELLEDLNKNWYQVCPKLLSFDHLVPHINHDNVSTKMRNYYFGTKKGISKENSDKLIKFYTNTFFMLPIMKEAKDMAREGLPVFPYMCSYQPLVCSTQKIGYACLPGKVGHMDELQHLFDHPVLGAGDKMSPNSDHEKFSKRLVKLWTRFADTGVPELDWEDNTTWIAAKPKEDGDVQLDILEIDASLSKFKNEGFQEELNFWKNAMKNMLNDTSDQKIFRK